MYGREKGRPEELQGITDEIPLVNPGHGKTRKASGALSLAL